MSKKLSLEERQNIEFHLNNGDTYRNIAKKLKRSLSTISDEINRNKVNGEYIAKKANHKSRVRRKNSKYRRIKRFRKDLPSIGVDAIYKYIYSVYGRKLEKHLWYKSKRYRHNRDNIKKKKLKDRTSIEKRPKYIEKRVQIGHYEGDFIVSKSSTTVLLVLIKKNSPPACCGVLLQ